jgi:hypothetical protein
MVSRSHAFGNFADRHDKPTCVELHFFFQKSNSAALNTATAALRTIIHQIVHQVPALLPILLERHELLSAKGGFEWSWENILGVLEKLLDRISEKAEVYLIFDALDECEASSRELLLDWVKEHAGQDDFVASLSEKKSILKIMITSRPDGSMSDELSGFPSLEITSADTADDMHALIQPRIRRVATQRRLKPDIVSRIVRFLESNAQGMFLWVVLIIKELERRDEPLSEDVLISKLTSTPLNLIET